MAQLFQSLEDPYNGKAIRLQIQGLQSPIQPVDQHEEALRHSLWCETI